MAVNIPPSQGGLFQQLRRYLGQLAFLDQVSSSQINQSAVQAVHVGDNQILSQHVDFKTLNLNHIDHPPWVAAPDWAASQAYTVGQYIVPSATPNLSNYCYRCITAGTSGSSPPAWFDPTQPVLIGGPVTDGGVIWQLWGFGVLIDPALLATTGTNPISGTGTLNQVISANTTNWNIFQHAGSPANPVAVTLTINAGVVLSSTSATTPALDTGSGWAAGSTITITNLGTVAGHGGAGGRGGGTNGSPGVGAHGGIALALHFTVTLANASGTISGGGGGGGGAGYGAGSGSYSGSIYGGGGGGGGQGQMASSGGAGGTGVTNAANGAAGSLNAPGVGGAGGKATYGGTAGGKGGNGGGPGQNGQIGQTGYAAGAASGGAGTAISLNGFALTWSGAHGTVNGPVS